ncbi:MAG TPA: DNA-formamidopyrimidine glycosylase family protein [Acidobacteriaceae bacterium]|nr:DNA-formamidopyrimidine glycosylase family protein [Acidobacteriaceae bacterium]
MPEGDTIFRAARALNKALGGRVITQFETTLAPLACVNDDKPVAGRTVERVEARGKWCLIFFSGDLILLTHMRMSGSWHIYKTGERWQAPRSAMRVVITCGDVQAVAFNVPVAEFHSARSLERSPDVPKLGVDVLSRDYSIDTAVHALQEYRRSHPDAEIGNVLLNQRVLAGIGNVYKSEIAFATGVNPFRTMQTISNRELERIAEIAERYMQANISEDVGEAIVTYTGNRRTTRAMDRGARLWVYGRHGQECRRCGAVIEMRRQGTGARSSYWCPSCQPWIDSEANTTVPS